MRSGSTFQEPAPFHRDPPDGYPLISRNNVLIDGYTQPGSAPNTNPILATNNARVWIVLDSRNGHSRLLDFPATAPTTPPGTARPKAPCWACWARRLSGPGVCFLGVPRTGWIRGSRCIRYPLPRRLGSRPRLLDRRGPGWCDAGWAERGRHRFPLPGAGRRGQQVTGNILVNDLVVGVGPAARTPRPTSTSSRASRASPSSSKDMGPGSRATSSASCRMAGTT